MSREGRAWEVLVHERKKWGVLVFWASLVSLTTNRYPIVASSIQTEPHVCSEVGSLSKSFKWLREVCILKRRWFRFTPREFSCAPRAWMALLVPSHACIKVSFRQLEVVRSALNDVVVCAIIREGRTVRTPPVGNFPGGFPRPAPMFVVVVVVAVIVCRLVLLLGSFLMMPFLHHAAVLVALSRRQREHQQQQSRQGQQQQQDQTQAQTQAQTFENLRPGMFVHFKCDNCPQWLKVPGHAQLVYCPLCG